MTEKQQNMEHKCLVISQFYSADDPNIGRLKRMEIWVDSAAFLWRPQCSRHYGSLSAGLSHRSRDWKQSIIYCILPSNSVIKARRLLNSACLTRNLFCLLLHLFSNNKAITDSSRKFLLSCKDKLKQSEENRASGWYLTRIYLLKQLLPWLYYVILGFFPQLHTLLLLSSPHLSTGAEQELKTTCKHIHFWTGKQLDFVLEAFFVPY